MTDKPPITPPPPSKTARPGSPAPVRRAAAFGPIPRTCTGHRTLLYGPGGIGKTTLAAQAPGPVVFLDLDDSLQRLRSQLEAQGVADRVRVAGGVAAWTDLREILQADGWDGVGTLVIDTATRAEELCAAHVIATVPHEKGHRVQRLEDYGYGKGVGHVFDSFLPLLGDLDRHCRAGRHVILVAHDCTATVPNPAGEDWLRYEPRLQSPASGKASIRLRVREWADHVLFMGYDVNVKDGKGQGAGTRTLYPAELPHCMAKSRTCQAPIPVSGDASALWRTLFDLSE